jgi:hypothetical protein
MCIGILAEGLAEWQGGIDFLRMILEAAAVDSTWEHGEERR